MTLEELNAARDGATRELLADGQILAQAEALLEAVQQLGAVGESAGHVTATLKHFIMQVNAFMVPAVTLPESLPEP
jgi:hypothetical protein